MSPHRWIIFALCILAPAVSFRVGGVGLWAVHGGACLLAAGLAVWLLHEDGVIQAVTQYRAGDATLAMVSAAIVYFPVALAIKYWIAPDDITHVLTTCGPRGAWLPRAGLTGLDAVAEYIRDRSCAAYVRSAGVRGPLRGVLILIVAGAEEVAWRVGVQRALAERLGRVRGWLLSALLFGLAHTATGNVTVGALALLAGLMFGGLYIVRAPAAPDDDTEGQPTFGTMYRGLGRIVPCVLGHCAFSWFFFYHSAPFVLRYESFGG